MLNTKNKAKDNYENKSLSVAFLSFMKNPNCDVYYHAIRIFMISNDFNVKSKFPHLFCTTNTTLVDS